MFHVKLEKVAPEIISGSGVKYNNGFIFCFIRRICAHKEACSKIDNTGNGASNAYLVDFAVSDLKPNIMLFA